ncbi:MAG: hypothetical protein RL026_2462 [Pseudomonadota bacterium]
MTLELHVLGRDGLVPALQAEWAGLEARAVEPNIYMSPLFVMPLLRHLMPKARLQCVTVRERGAGRLVGIALLLSAAPSVAWPMPHSLSFTSMHSYLSGWLVDAEHLDDATRVLVDGWLGGAFGPGCLVWPDLALEGPTARSLRHCAEARGCRISVSTVRERATLCPPAADEDAIRAHAGSRRMKDWGRKRRRLAELGEVVWRVSGPEDSPATLTEASERFAELENQGWRASGGTALLADPAQAAFYRDMAARMIEARRLVISETCMDGRVIAANFNMLSGNHGFAFKLGWDPAYSKYSVGVLNELALVDYFHARQPALQLVDSGTQPGSFMEDLWPGRVQLGTLALARPGVPSLLLRLREALHAIKARLHSRKGTLAPADSQERATDAAA